jgi:hypothetical protein
MTMDHGDECQCPQCKPKGRAVFITPRGIALGDFAFRDGLALGLSEEEAYSIAKRLIEQWDGSESLLQMYQRTEVWPAEVI